MFSSIFLDNFKMIPVENVDLNGANQTHESITPQGERDDSSEESLKKQNLF